MGPNLYYRYSKAGESQLDKFRDFFFNRGVRPNTHKSSDNVSRRTPHTQSIITKNVDTKKFADTVVKKYGETLVLLGKE